MDGMRPMQGMRAVSLSWSPPRLQASKTWFRAWSKISYVPLHNPWLGQWLHMRINGHPNLTFNLEGGKDAGSRECKYSKGTAPWLHVMYIPFIINDIVCTEKCHLLTRHLIKDGIVGCSNLFISGCKNGMVQKVLRWRRW